MYSQLCKSKHLENTPIAQRCAYSMLCQSMYLDLGIYYKKNHSKLIIYDIEIRSYE